MKVASKAEKGEDWICKLASSLARPVARGWLSYDEASAVLLRAAVRGSRTGAVTHDPLGVARCAQHILRLNIERLSVQRLLAAEATRRTLRPLLAVHASESRIRSTAHACNAAADYQLGSDEVEEIAAAEAWSFLHPENTEIASHD